MKLTGRFRNDSKKVFYNLIAAFKVIQELSPFLKISYVFFTLGSEKFVCAKIKVPLPKLAQTASVKCHL